jgi:hypothetical protein
VAARIAAGSEVEAREEGSVAEDSEDRLALPAHRDGRFDDVGLLHLRGAL